MIDPVGFFCNLPFASRSLLAQKTAKGPNADSTRVFYPAIRPGDKGKSPTRRLPQGPPVGRAKVISRDAGDAGDEEEAILTRTDRLLRPGGPTAFGRGRKPSERMYLK